MMRHLLTLFMLSCASGLYAQRTFDVTIADSTYHMKQYWFVLYTKGDGPALDSLTSARMQQEHLDHQAAQAKRGLIVMAGPFGDNGDWRGLLLYDCDTREEVQANLDADSFVRARRLKYEIHPWYGAIGTTLR